ncbi:DUF397 domain-containing protein [Streptomyces albidoflavus]
MPSTSIDTQWVRSSFSGAQGDCVECGNLGHAVAVRDSKNPAGPALVVSRGALDQFLGAVRAGRLA